MAWYFSNSTKGFYHDDHHDKEKMPADCVKISDETRELILRMSSEGRGVSIDKKGKPSFTDHSLALDERWKIFQRGAQMALSASSEHLMHYYEKGEPVPKELVDYRNELRRIISEPAGTPGVLPEPPPLS